MSDQDNTEELMPCPVCKKSIPHGARKCTECSSYLDWRRFLGVSQTTLALLIALISLVSTTAPTFYNWITPDYSKLHAEVRQVYREKLELFVSNQGNKIGRLISVSLGATDRSGKTYDPIVLEVAHDGQIMPNSSTVVHLTVHPENVIQFLSWPFPDLKRCTLSLRMANYRELPATTEVDCAIKTLTLFCKGTEGAAKEFGRVPAFENHCT